VIFDNPGHDVGRRTVPGGAYEFSITARTYGDVRGNHDPLAAKDASLVAVGGDDVVHVTEGEVFELPVTLTQELRFAAMFLDLYYDTGKLEVLDVHSDIPGLIYAVDNGHIRVSFADATAVQTVSPGQGLVSLELRTISPVRAEDELFFQGVDTEFGDVQAGPISDFTLSISGLDNTVVGVSDLDQAGISLTAYPNPFRDELHLSYGLTEASDVRITIVNAMGAKVAEVVNQFQDAGHHQVVYQPESMVYHPESLNFHSGVYFIRMEVVGAEATVRQVVRMLYMD